MDYKSINGRNYGSSSHDFILPIFGSIRKGTGSDLPSLSLLHHVLYHVNIRVLMRPTYI